MKSLLALAVGVAATLQYKAAAQTITLDGTTALQVYDGHGALSAGASSRLLWDYQEPYRSQVRTRPTSALPLHSKI